jgi:predicted esterase
MARIAVHGHSMGSYVDAVLVSAYPTDFRAASSTGGGVRPDFIIAGPAPSPRQVRGVRTPYQLHHGDADRVVPLSYDQRFDSLLTAIGAPHELNVYPGADHLAVGRSPLMLERVYAWYSAHGMFR